MLQKHQNFIKYSMPYLLLILKVPITIAADNNSDFFLIFFLEKTSHDISCESSAEQMIHMKCQDLFSLKKKNEVLEC